MQCLNDGKSHWMAKNAKKFGGRLEMCIVSIYHTFNVANIGNFVKKIY